MYDMWNLKIKMECGRRTHLIIVVFGVRGRRVGVHGVGVFVGGTAVGDGDGIRLRLALHIP